MASLIELAQTDPGKARKRLNQIRNKEFLDGYIKGAISMLSPGDIVVEFGANVGAMTTQFAKSGAKIFAYEADPLAAAQLKTNLAGQDNVEIFEHAVAMRDGSTALYRSPKFNEVDLTTTIESTIINYADLDFVTDMSVEVKNAVTILQDILAKHDDIAVLYIDINGAEVEVIEALIAEGLLDKIRVSVVVTYQKNMKAFRDRYREARLRAETRPEWNITFTKA